MKPKYLILILIGLAGVFVGVGLDRTVLGSLHLEPNVNITDLLTLILTVIIAILIPTTIQKSINNTDFQKNQLSKKIESILECYKFIDKLYRECYLNQNLDANTKTLIVSKFKEVSVEIHLVIELIRIYFPEAQTIRVQDLKNQRQKYHRVITGGNFSSISTIDVESSNRAFQAFREININITHLMFELNLM